VGAVGESTRGRFTAEGRRCVGLFLPEQKLRPAPEATRRKRRHDGPKSPGAPLTPKATIVDGSPLARIGNAEIVRTAIMFDSCETR
jgi:hypothetical protein